MLFERLTVTASKGPAQGRIEPPSRSKQTSESVDADNTQSVRAETTDLNQAIGSRKISCVDPAPAVSEAALNDPKGAPGK